MSQIFIIDNGTGFLKIGMSGEDTPQLVIPALVGRKKDGPTLWGTPSKDLFLGYEAQEEVDFLNVSYPMKNGNVQNWDDLRSLFEYAVKKVNADPQNLAVIICVAPNFDNNQKIKIAEILLKDLNFKSIHIGLQAEMVLYATLKKTGVVLDVGDGVSHVVPICSNNVVTDGIKYINVAGHDVTKYFGKLLEEEGLPTYITTDLEFLREVKEKMLCC